MFFTLFHPYLNPYNYSFLRVPRHRYTNTGLNGAKNMSKQGCWNNLYQYTFDLYRYRLPTAYLYRYTLDLYRYRLPTAYLYRYSSTCTGTPYRFLPRNVRDFAFSHIFHPQLFSNSSHIKNPPWNLPKNNSKCGLDSIKSIFLKLGLFTQNPNQNMRLGF